MVHHILPHCPNYNYITLIHETGTEVLCDILSRPNCAQAAAKWFIAQEIFPQLHIARDINNKDTGTFSICQGCEGPSLRHGPVIWLAGELSRTARIFQNYRIGYINRCSHPVAFLSLALAIMNPHSV
jgi:hypothetical protein